MQGENDRVREQQHRTMAGYCITTDGWTAGDVTIHRHASDQQAGNVAMRTTSTMGAAAVRSEDAILPAAPAPPNGQLGADRD